MVTSPNPSTSCQHIGRLTVSILQATTRGYVAFSQLPTHPLQTCNHQVKATAATPTPQACCQSKPLPTPLAQTHCNNTTTQYHYPLQYIAIFEAQERIAWIHFMQGCFAMLWVCTAKQQGINGTILYTKVTQLCWQYVVTSWVECNHALHDSTQLYNISQLHTTVHNAAQHPDTQAAIYDQTI